MDFEWINKIVDLIKESPINGLILIGVLFFISIIMYKKVPFIQKLINYLPFIKKEYVIVANFSKKEGKIGHVKSKYTELGCKAFILNPYKKFSVDGTILKENLQELVTKQQKTMLKARKLMKNNNSFIYMGFPHIPLGFLDGINFADIDEPKLYEYQGMNSECLGKGLFELKNIYNSTLKLIDNLDEKEIYSNEVALKIEQSFEIKDEDIKRAIDVFTIISFGPKNVSRWGVTNYAQIDIYQREFQKILTKLKDKEINTIHLFATTPVSLSFSLGRAISHYHPEVIVYNYNNGNFDWGINLTTKEIVFYTMQYT